MRRITFAIAVVVAFLGGTAAASTPFTDISANTHAANIDAIYNAGITSGCTPTTYCPDNPVTRAQMGTFLARGLGLGRGNLPKARGRSEAATYCALASRSPGSFASGTCASTHVAFNPTANINRPAIAIGVDGLPIITYGAAPNLVVVAHCDTIVCSSAFETTLSTNAPVGVVSAIAIGSDGLPVIAFNETGSQITVAHCTVIDCSSFTALGASAGLRGINPSITIASDGFPLFTFYAPDLDVVASVNCTALDCAGTNSGNSFASIPDSAGGFLSTVTVDATGQFVIAFTSSGKLKVYRFGATSVIDDQGHAAPSIAIGTDGFPIISTTTGGQPRITHCADLGCTQPATVTQFGTQNGSLTSIAIGYDGFPLVVTSDSGSGDIDLFRCAARDCTGTPVATTLATDHGTNPTMTIAPDGRPTVVYRSAPAGAARVVRPGLS